MIDPNPGGVDWAHKIEAVATVVLAVFGGVQIWRERKRQLANQRSAEAQASTAAYLLRRQLRSWLGTEPHDAGGVWSWIQRNYAQNGVMRSLDRAETRVTRLANLSHRLPGAKATKLDEAFVHFLQATGIMTTIVAQTITVMETTRFTEPPVDWTQGVERELGACLDLLEEHVIARNITGFEKDAKLTLPKI